MAANIVFLFCFVSFKKKMLICFVLYCFVLKKYTEYTGIIYKKKALTIIVLLFTIIVIMVVVTIIIQRYHTKNDTCLQTLMYSSVPIVG